MLITGTVDSKYIKSDEIQGRQVTLTISHVVMEDVGMGTDLKRKPICYFQGQEKGLVLNVTNRLMMKEAFGDETDNWTGKKVILYTEPTMFQGKPVRGLRVKPLVPAEPFLTESEITEATPKRIRTNPPEQPPWEPAPSIITEGEAIAKQGMIKFRDWRDRLSEAEYETLRPELKRISAIAKAVGE